MIGAPMDVRKHAALLALIAIAAPLMFAFTIQARLATFGDDSVSYIVLARYFEGAASDPLLSPWAAYQSHFPPLLPLLLWITGGAHDYRVGYAVVAACAVGALPLIARFDGKELASARAGLTIVFLFLLMPVAWITLKGVLSESLYLLTSMAALVFHASRIEDREATAPDYLVLGLLLALACLARAMGILLVGAFAAQVAVRWVASRRRPDPAVVLALALPLLAIAAWHALRPSIAQDIYQRTAELILGRWRGDPAGTLQAAWHYFGSGWIAAFTAQDDVSLQVKVVVLAAGALVLCGLAMRLARNRLDAWFAAASLAVIFAWVFTPDNTRRLLYPLLPVLLVAAGEAAMRIASRVARGREAWLVGALCAAGVAVSAPALAMVARKAMDDEIVIPGYAYTYREVADYYATVNFEVARERAKLSVVTMAGLEEIAAQTPPGARLMWMRPEYVALLGRRAAVPFLYRWTPLEFARAVKESRVDYIVQSWLYKTDLEGHPQMPHLDADRYTTSTFGIGPIFVLAKVDPAKLDAYLATSAAGSMDRSR